MTRFRHRSAAVAFGTLAMLSLFVERPRGDKAEVITETSVRAHMTFLAGDALNGRGSGTRDEWIAAAYIGAQMRRWGIEPLGDNGDFVQAIETPRGELASPPMAMIGDTKLTHGKEMLAQTIGAPHVSGPLQKFRKATPVTRGAVLLVFADEVPDTATECAKN